MGHCLLGEVESFGCDENKVKYLQVVLMVNLALIPLVTGVKDESVDVYIFLRKPRVASRYSLD